MFLAQLSIRNYKSLRDISFSPSPITALVGPNAAGKSNIGLAINFLSEIYSHGLELAVSRNGGYENIAYRKQRRSKAPIEFEVVFEIDGGDRRLTTLLLRQNLRKYRIRFTHKFSFVAKGTGIKAAFNVHEELFSAVALHKDEEEKSDSLNLVKLARKDNKYNIQADENALRPGQSVLFKQGARELSSITGEQELLTSRSTPIGLLPLARDFAAILSQFRTYQISTNQSRDGGFPSPNPVLTSSGENLPALADWVKKKHPSQWEIVMSAMKDILPHLRDISVEYLSNKALGLFFSEEGFGRPWRADEVSDGTILSLAALLASVDPRSSLIFIDEPENSVHSWILRVLVNRFREVSKQKNVILTSHSPVLINMLTPDEIWVVYRTNGETQLRRLIDFDQSISESWKSGNYQLSEFLDSGAVSQAVPGGVF